MIADILISLIAVISLLYVIHRIFGNKKVGKAIERLSPEHPGVERDFDTISHHPPVINVMFSNEDKGDERISITLADLFIKRDNIFENRQSKISLPEEMLIYYDSVQWDKLQPVNI